MTLLLAAVGMTASPRPATAFIAPARWAAAASGSTGLRGEPATLSWSLVPDGTPIPDRTTSSLISFLDASFGAGSRGGDLTDRPWFRLIESAFDRWSELGGVEFRYEPNDDRAPLNVSAGELNKRGDVRLAGAPADGAGGTLATSQFPDAGDIVLDIDEASRFTNPAGDFLRFRNTLMHEIGHVLGLDHVTSSNADMLMEPALLISADGPQLDDIRALHYLYGDIHERAHDGGGNDSPSQAIPLGVVPAGDSVVLGGDAGGGTSVAAGAVDFLSIANRTDVDYFSFEVAAASVLNVELVPRGGRFRQAEIGQSEVWVEANESSDLSFALFAADETLLAGVNELPSGGIERLVGYPLPGAGRYYVRVSGSRQRVQLYELRIQIDGMPAPEPAGSALAATLLGLLLPFHRSLMRQRRS